MTFLPSDGLLPVLNAKRIVLGVSGGIAAYKAAELVRLLVKQKAQVQVVMTESACEFVQPLTFQALSGNPVHVSQWNAEHSSRAMPHIDIGRWADLFLIAPCTANTLANLVHGKASSLLENLLLARDCPAALAPAMNIQMWNNPATQRNLDQLRQDGYLVFGPGHGEQACGEYGDGRMLETHQLVLELARAATAQTWKGKHVLLTAGPTSEPIDPVRCLTNQSSGKMGYCLALAAWLKGAEVHLVSGPTALAGVYGVHTQLVQTAQQMHQAVKAALKQQPFDLFAGVAAVADYAVQNPSDQKLKKSKSAQPKLELELAFNPDILANTGKQSESNGNPKCVLGFAAETHNLDEYAQKKLVLKKAHFMAANSVQTAMGQNQTQISLWQTNATGTQPTHLKGNKLEVALQILDAIHSTL